MTPTSNLIAPDFRVVRTYLGEYIVGHVVDHELVNALPHTFATSEQAEEALAELERAEADEVHGTSNLIIARAHQRADEQTDVLNLIRSLAEVYGNADTVREELALEAVSDGRAAWWVTTKHDNQTLLNVALHANRRSLAPALKAFCDDSYPSEGRHTLYVLASLIPLNKQAVAEKEEAVANAVKGRAV